MYLNDEQGLMELFDNNGMSYHRTELYASDGTNQLCGSALWLDVGHIEFNEIGMITNIVNY